MKTSIIVITIVALTVVGITSSLERLYWNKVEAKGVVMAEEEVAAEMDNSILDYDFTPTVYPIPPRYHREGLINPFLEVKKDKPKVVKSVAVPHTALTKWVLTQLNLTGVVITDKRAFAYFVGPYGGKAHRGKAGDFIGRSGAKIASITTGMVHLSNGRDFVINR